MGMIALGIDAGGSETRALAVRAGRVVHEGRGGPGNPAAVEAAALRAHFAAALDGCPEPAAVAVCAAGVVDARTRSAVEAVLREHFPRAPARVLPDYAAAWAAAPEGVAAVVVAGTGSVVCRRAPGGEFEVAGGLGWVIGDHGSAARLGRALLDWLGTADPVPGDAVTALAELYGTADARTIAADLHVSPAPAAFLARAAPVLAVIAAGGDERARVLIADEMRSLAATTVAVTGTGAGLRVALAGGVWRSAACREAFAAALAALAAGATTTLVRREPVEGAVRLAQELAG
jgi:N-acetylglucosamine kinase-like BadF-type ATPase